MRAPKEMYTGCKRVRSKRRGLGPTPVGTLQKAYGAGRRPLESIQSLRAICESQPSLGVSIQLFIEHSS
jgi:hypothetical protein